MFKIITRVIASFIALLIMVGLVVGVGAYAYQVGMQQGVAQVAAGAAGDGAVATPRFAPMYYGYGFHPFGWGFGFLGCLAPLFFIFLFFSVFRLIRYAIWGPRWGWGHHRWHRHWGKGMPPVFEEWHKQAHGEKPSERSPKE